MVNIKDVQEDIKNIAQRHDVSIFHAADLFNKDIDAVFHCDYQTVLTELKEKKPFIQRSPFLTSTFFGESLINLDGVSTGGYYSPFFNALLEKDKLDLSIHYHELAHALQKEQNLFSDCTDETYKSYLNEMHSECFSYAALILQSENLIDFARQAHFAYKRGLIMTNEAFEKDGTKLYASLPVMKEMIKQLWKQRHKKASFFREDGGIDENALSQFALDIVNRKAYSQQWFENFSKNHKERSHKYKFLLNRKLIRSQDFLALILPSVFKKKSDLKTFVRNSQKLENMNNERIQDIQFLVKRAFNLDMKDENQGSASWVKEFLRDNDLSDISSYQGALLHTITTPPKDKKCEDYNALRDVNTLQKLKKLLKNGIDIDARDVLGYTALMKAENIEKTILLADNGADINATSKIGMTALMTAQTAKQTDFLLKSGAKIDAQDNFGYTALMLVKTAKQAKVLLRAGADTNIKNCHGQTAYDFIEKNEYISEKKRQKILRVLENYNSSHKKNSLFEKVSQKFSKLYDNISHNYYRYKRKIKTGAIALAITVSGTSFAVQQKIEHDHEQKVTELKATLKDFSYFIFDPSFSDLFDLDKVVDDVNAKNAFGETPLIACLRLGELQTASKLIEFGADVNARNNDGETALMYAQDSEIAKLLIEAGADVNAKDNKGLTISDHRKRLLYEGERGFFSTRYTVSKKRSDNVRSRIEHHKEQYHKVSDGLKRTKMQLKNKNEETDVHEVPKVKGRIDFSAQVARKILLSSSENEQN